MLVLFVHLIFMKSSFAPRSSSPQPTYQYTLKSSVVVIATVHFVVSSIGLKIMTHIQCVVRHDSVNLSWYIGRLRKDDVGKAVVEVLFITIEFIGGYGGSA